MTTDNRAQYDSYGAAGYVKVVFHEETEGYLVIHPAHGQSEWEENKQIGRMLVEFGDAVVLLPNQEGRPSPDALRNGEEWEFKTVATENLARGIQHALRRGKTQSSNIVCLVTATEFHVHEITRGIYNAVKFDKKQQIQRIGILFQSGYLVEVNRHEVVTRAFFKKFLP